MGTKERLAVLLVAANTDVPRWVLAKIAGISPSRLSVICCCPLGQQYLTELRQMPPDRLAPCRLTETDLAEMQIPLERTLDR